MPQNYLAMNQALRIYKAKLMLAIKLFSALLVSFFFSTTVSAQVFDSGPSDPALFTNVFNLPEDVLPNSDSVGGVAGETVQLNVANGGSVGSRFSVFGGSEFNISGGSVISFESFIGSEVNISGGSVTSFRAEDSEVSISGGSVSDFWARNGSEVSISGGFMGGFNAEPGSEVIISGGSVGETFRALDGSDVELVGGEFKLNGESFAGPNITLDVTDVLTGTLADGTPFIFGNFLSSGGASISDVLNDVTLTPSAAPLPEANLVPIVISIPSELLGLRSGQSLTLQSGGELDSNFDIVDATLNVEGGSVESDLRVAGGIVNISGGSVGFGFRALIGSEVNITGGSVDLSFDAQTGSKVNISGGSVGFGFRALGGSEVNVSGGSVGNNFLVCDGSEVIISDGSVGSIFAAIDSEVNISGGTVNGLINALNFSTVNISGGSVTEGLRLTFGSVLNVSGGSVGDTFEARNGSTMNLLGSDFVLDGVLLDDLVLGEAFTILDRDVTLSGLLADGSPFSFDLDSVPTPTQFGFEPDATVTVTLVSPVILGDVNQRRCRELFWTSRLLSQSSPPATFKPKQTPTKTE